MSGKVIQPPEDGQAAALIRSKLEALYSQEPDAKQELEEAKSAGRHRSKHEQFMHQLGQSGKSLAQIQTEWHNYYLALPDNEKHQVWQEFYANYSRQPIPAQHSTATELPSHHQSKHHFGTVHAAPEEPVADIKKSLQHKVVRRQKSKRSQHAQSLLFGLGMGTVVVAVMLFGFFNERFIAPFITPSRNVSSSSIIIDPNNTAIGNDPVLIIPKINVEIPVVYDEPSIEEDAVQKALERGVLHYATTSKPGEQGNGVIFGHSSNNILNGGKYKFAFVLLKRLEPNDIFYVQKDGKRYGYKVYDKKIVNPDETSVLNAKDKPATFTLITCDPPGTSLKRLVVVGEQISPDPLKNVASSAQTTASAPAALPSNAPTLWSRIRDWLSS
jgi:sortase A